MQISSLILIDYCLMMALWPKEYVFIKKLSLALIEYHPMMIL